MYKWLGFMLVICLLILSGCANSAAYQNEDVAAIVRGEEITIGQLRLLYPDDVIPEMVEGVVKAKLAEQDVKKMKIDISEQVEEIKESYGAYPSAELKDPQAQSIRTFADAGSEHFAMNAEKYYTAYTDSSAEMAAYVKTYVSVFLGELEEAEDGIDEYNQDANKLLDELVEENRDEIEILIEVER